MRTMFIICLVLAVACEKDELQNPLLPVGAVPKNWVVYGIDSGNHYSNQNLFQTFKADSLAFLFAFDSSAVYQTINPANQSSWNKLFGFADCNSHHHTNSVRLSWRYKSGVGIELAGYYYSGAVRTWQVLATIQPADTLGAFIYTTDSTYELQVGNHQISSARGCTGQPAGYLLYPYFGGTEPAPQNIRIFVQHL